MFIELDLLETCDSVNYTKEFEGYEEARVINIT
jgi:hypothetical protein